MGGDKMMKFLKVFPVFLLLLFILSACESGEISRLNQDLTNQLGEANKQIKNLREQLKQTENILNQSKEQFLSKNTEFKNKENQIQGLLYEKQKINSITELSSFEYIIVSERIKRPPYDTVVYIKNVPGSKRIQDREIFVLRAAIEFSGRKYDKVSLWNDYQKAQQYVEGDYDPEEGVFGWSGFHSRFGSIDNSPDKPRLSHYLSVDDVDAINFGKYKNEN